MSPPRVCEKWRYMLSLTRVQPEISRDWDRQYIQNSDNNEQISRDYGRDVDDISSVNTDEPVLKIAPLP